jgi:hypothetical protein
MTLQPPLVLSSYAPEEVSFLLTDLSGVALELGMAERERAVQGGRNYAEMLPVEYAPGPVTPAPHRDRAPLAPSR